MPATRPLVGATHIYAILEVSPAAYAEIREQLAAARYAHAFHSEARSGVGPEKRVAQPMVIRALKPRHRLEGLS